MSFIRRLFLILLASAMLAACTLPLPPEPPTPAPASLGLLAYVWEGNIWVQRLPHGAPQQITTDGGATNGNDRPLWAPSGQWLAFRKFESQLWLYSLTTGAVKAIDQQAPVNDFAWSPAADRLAYTVGSGVVHLRMLAAGSAESVMLTQPLSSGYPRGVYWSPDGQWLAYTWVGETENGEFQQEIRLQAVLAGEPGGEPGGEPKVLMGGGKAFLEPSLELSGWMPSGQALLMWRGPRAIDSFLPETITLQVLPVAGGPPSDCTAQATWMLLHEMRPAPRQDAVAVTVGAGPSWTAKRIAIDGRPLTAADQVAVQPAWSPDGRSIAYSGMPDPGLIMEGVPQALAQRRLWLAAAAGEGAARALTADPAYRDEHPEWSADGAYLLFARLDEQGNGSLWIIPAAGGAAQEVAPAIQVFDQGDPRRAYLGWERSFAWLPQPRLAGK